MLQALGRLHARHASGSVSSQLARAGGHRQFVGAASRATCMTKPSFRSAVPSFLRAGRRQVGSSTFGASSRAAGSSTKTTWRQADALSIGLVVGGVIGCATFSYKAFAKSLGWIVEHLVESCDKKFLGVDINIGRMTIHPLDLKIKIKGLTLHNPEGDWSSPYVLHAKTVLLDLDAWSIVNPWSSKIVVQKVKFVDASLHVECKLSMEDSNVGMVGHVHKDHKPRPPPPKKKELDTRNPQDIHPVHHREWVLEHVNLKDISVSYSKGWISKTVQISDITYKHFSEEVGGSFADDLAILLVKSIAKTVLSELTSPAIAQHLL